MSTWKKLEPEDIREIHKIMLQKYGGVPGEHEPGLIDYMADKPFQGYFGQDQYPGLFMKAAVYMYGFATSQYFVDGNKRTAYGCAAVFLELNGYSLMVNDDEMYRVCKNVANKAMSLDELAAWLEKYSL
ncbi:type II toxin-antitoxin system death-on-curing family toxin [Aneurinibacillus terranovensis]|uniref:type II toxin-antitoxin system death-on-curing family toxin n=1 Tax=Aneurinibacillus terranovensis TaxID=278991 RepID=UPI0003FDB540|nr:type II toxin-antitoxin system death-on-curing family toxin [Aneurinibacillus terranovensis]